MEETVHNELRSLSHIIYRFIENLPNKKKIESMTGTNGCIIGYLAENSGHDVFQKDIEGLRDNTLDRFKGDKSYGAKGSCGKAVGKL